MGWYANVSEDFPLPYGPEL